MNPQHIWQEFEEISGNRGNWESHWDEIARQVWPAYQGSFNAQTSPGEKRTEYMYDSTALLALDRFSSILDSLLTPRNATWHQLMPSNPDLM